MIPHLPFSVSVCIIPRSRLAFVFLGHRILLRMLLLAGAKVLLFHGGFCSLRFHLLSLGSVITWVFIVLCWLEQCHGKFGFLHQLHFLADRSSHHCASGLLMTCFVLKICRLLWLGFADALNIVLCWHHVLSPYDLCCVEHLEIPLVRLGMSCCDTGIVDDVPRTVMGLPGPVYLFICNSATTVLPLVIWKSILTMQIIAKLLLVSCQYLVFRIHE